MTFSNITVFFLVLICTGLGTLWIKQIGAMRGTLAWLCRMIWISPCLLAFYPLHTLQELPKTMNPQSIHVLIDDSDSMLENLNGSSPLKKSMKHIEGMEEVCDQVACKVIKTLLSDIAPATREGYSPINQGLKKWFQSVRDEPWGVFTDGGDFQPSQEWDQELKDLGLDSDDANKKKGFIVAFSDIQESNYWIDRFEIPPFAFENKEIHNILRIRRKVSEPHDERIQVQVLLGGTIIGSENISFEGQQDVASTSFSLSSLPRGRQLLSVKLLASAHEKNSWDNEIHREIEVLPNTVGILHLLGSPSWDGRFLRRYFKSEPKYDLISFFILRDPWDQQGASERELSLIPFPVSRLFNEEINNFKLIVIQNFSLLQFLMPEYQRNLVEFVKNGGGLLFLGGPRALTLADMENSPLREILPFKLSAKTEQNPLAAFTQNNPGEPVKQIGPWFQKDLDFEIELAKPKTRQRSLANVYESWLRLKKPLQAAGPLTGLHHMENVEFDQEHSTPLLNAKLSDGRKTPLAVASYPGKGRAIWLFSDSIWRVGLQAKQQVPREIHLDLLHGALTWLLRDDFEKPLRLSQFGLNQKHIDKFAWHMHLEGPVVQYFNEAREWRVTVCGEELEFQQISRKSLGNQRMKISGTLSNRLKGGQRCEISLAGQHPAFGSVHETATAIFSQTYKDSQISAASQKTVALADLTQAELHEEDDKTQFALNRWIDRVSISEGVALATRYKSKLDYYWFLDSFWIYLVLIFIPLEVILRRWHLLFEYQKPSQKKADTT